MDTNSAAEHLQTIRTLMERSAVYRRALAPVTIAVGSVGTVAAAAGYFLGIESPGIFVPYWFGVAAVAISGALLLIRRQALKDCEPFWSPPTRRVAQSLLPALTVGLVVGALFSLCFPSSPGLSLILVLAWMTLYGCALNAAGFFMQRGIKLLGWLFILSGCVLMPTVFYDWLPVSHDSYPEIIMGAFFGLLHLGYGAYLYFTEKGKNAA